ncbi:hypothetical protein AYO49_05900 [Verrucomicrobiaceae bacterium SCGC AG-212-N21]|nr:hypothetical protein AYO49_05900 [Verrucomicrobiaceae bacterium SCGC AG-212-N21]
MNPGFLYQRFAFRDIEAERFKRVLDRADFEHTIVARQRGNAVVEQIHGPHFSIDTGCYAFPVVARGQFAPGCMCIGMAMGQALPTWINGFTTGRGNLQIYLEGADVLYRAGAGGVWTGLTVTRERLQAEALHRLGRELRISNKGGMEHLRVDAALFDRLRRLILSMPPKFGAISRQPEDMDAAIIGAYVEAYATADASLADRVRRRAAYRLDVVLRADLAMRHLIGLPYSSAKLCQHLGVSERNLELHFREAFGVTPKTWFRHLALHRARTLLLRGTSEMSAVTRVALDCGFEHLGRFSEYYRNLFGELPSETFRGLHGNRQDTGAVVLPA